MHPMQIVHERNKGTALYVICTTTCVCVCILEPHARCTHMIRSHTYTRAPSVSAGMHASIAYRYLHTLLHHSDEPRACTIIIFIQVLALFHRAQVLT